MSLSPSEKRALMRPEPSAAAREARNKVIDEVDSWPL